jgi:predicted O-methyltransferase YrrM
MVLNFSYNESMGLKRKLWQQIRESLPRKFFSTPFAYLLLDHIEPYVYMDNWSSLPFNGQSRRMRIISDISQKLDVGAVIETGTYLGSSTPYLAGMFSCKTYTIEIDPFNAERSRMRFEHNHQNLDIEIKLGDSEVKIVEVLGVIDSREIVFAYLDAHWFDAIPTKAEIQALLDWGGQWVAVVDDFEVPGDSGYKFDSYGQRIIGLEIIPSDPNIEVWVPKESSALESGVCSGTGYIFSDKFIRMKLEGFSAQMVQLR